MFFIIIIFFTFILTFLSRILIIYDGSRQNSESWAAKVPRMLDIEQSFKNILLILFAGQKKKKLSFEWNFMDNINPCKQ